MRYMSFAAVIFGVGVYYFCAKLMSRSEKTGVTWDALPEEIQQWRKIGQTVKVNGREMFYVFRQCSDPNLTNPPTFALVHGYPSSSFDYHKVVENLTQYGHVIMNDHIGFGFSEAPVEDYTYSLSEAAENLLALWRHLRIKSVHIISHDMGDSVVTEILARRHRKMLPSYFDDFFSSVMFTNGGMQFKLINFRISQYVSMYPFLGKLLTQLANKIGIAERIFKAQIRSIWSPRVQNLQDREEDIHHLYLIHALNDKLLYGYKNMYYLWDRSKFEFRWFDALRNLDIPCRFVWSDSDSVSPITIPQSFKDMVPNFQMTIIEGNGHFWMLENPDAWINEAVKVIN